MQFIQLPTFLKPSRDFPLKRLGSARDGGYLVDERLLGCNLLSLGISGDWNFEKDWTELARPDCIIATYDGSIGLGYFVRVFLASLLRPHRPELLLRNFKNVVEYVTYLRLKTKFQKKYVGAKSGNGDIAFAEIIEEHRIDSSWFLKMDIEGAEYEILDTISELGSHFSGMAIEFHDPLRHMQLIEQFIAATGLSICNVHVNNCLPKHPKSTVEPCIEVSLSCLDGFGKPEIPHPLEQQNDSTCEPLAISFID
jgi:hypothetical protein